ncbi:unnamed protein product [Fraxinus pennsylvanica]|uniref:glutamine synthetase n=1 Tax=Fraxinus pennsylvanica TaxID=56036 RepID=A0AAD1YPP1_9LAMI|nr:unnamed protein product [Fraxinus pennsylvanica]
MMDLARVKHRVKTAKSYYALGQHFLILLDEETISLYKSAEIFNHPDVNAEEPWFGIEQEYTLFQQHAKWPVGWPVGGFPGPQGPYYCGIGADKSFGREIVDAYYKACLYAGIEISEFQVGPAVPVGISAGDQLWVARYILERITEIAGIVLSFDPKPIPGDWYGADAHTNYSTKSMRSEEGKHETANIKTFKWGMADREASIRVGRETERDGKGYFEDRRPASNMDPYVVTSMITETTILWKP